MRTGLRGSQGLALVSVLTVIFVLVLLSALVLYLSGKEIGLSAVRTLATQAMAIAEGGGYSGRAALIAFVNADPVDASAVSPAVNEPTLRN
jgi:type II secretory pathway component PulK